MSEDAWMQLADLRWPGKQRCANCQSDRIGFVETRNLFRCLNCRHEFQVFTGTAFDNSKVNSEAIVAAARAYVGHGGERGAITAMSRTAGVSYKSALVLARKFAECANRGLAAGLETDTVGGLLLACLLSKPSATWRGYWQRHEILARAKATPTQQG